MNPPAARIELPPGDPWLCRGLLVLTAPLGPLLRLFRVDLRQYRALLVARLRADLRRRVGESSGVGSLRMNLAFGLMVGLSVGLLILVRAPSPATFMTMLSVVVVLFSAVLMVGDFTHVLFDVADLHLVEARPVSGRTLLAVRLTHVACYVGLLAASMVLGPAVLGCFVFDPGPYLTALLLTTVASVLWGLVLVLVFYLAALRWFSVELLHDAVVYVQVSFMVLAMVWPRLVGFDGNWTRDVETAAAWTAWVPPCHYGGLFAALIGTAAPGHRLLALFSLALPPVLLGAVLAAAGGTFQRALQAMRFPPARRERRPNALFRPVGRLVARGALERAGYEMFLSHAARERSFRMRAYPALVMPLVVMVTSSLADRTGRSWILAYYLVLYVAPSVLAQMRFSDAHRASWLLRAAPLGLGISDYVSGALKAVCCAVVVPSLGAAAVLALVLHGTECLPHVAVAAPVVLLASLALCHLLGRAVPFTRRFRQSDSMVAFALGLVLAGIGLYFLHLQILRDARVSVAVALLATAGSVILFARLRRVRPDWEAVELPDLDLAPAAPAPREGVLVPAGTRLDPVRDR